MRLPLPVSARRWAAVLVPYSFMACVDDRTGCTEAWTCRGYEQPCIAQPHKRWQWSSTQRPFTCHCCLSRCSIEKLARDVRKWTER